MSLEGLYDTDVEPESSSAMPEHKCTAQIVESSSNVDSAAGKATIKLVWVLLDGPYKGRKVWQYLMTKHPNKQVSDIANASFAAVRIAFWGPSGQKKIIRDLAELHGIPCAVTVTAKPDKIDSNKIWNGIDKPRSLVGNPQGSSPSGGSSPPWSTPKTEDRF